MTAQPRRRRRSTVTGLVLGAILGSVAIALAVVGAVTLANSTEGSAVVADERPVSVFPPTPNAALAVVDDDGAVTSLVVATLLPDGQGGSLVTVPTKADVNSGLEPERTPLDAVFDPDDPDAFAEELAGMLGVTLERFEVVDGARLAELIEPVTPASVDLPADVVDSSGVGTGIIATEGEVTLRRSLAVDALTAVDEDADPAVAHAIDVAVWSGLAGGTPIPGGSVEVDDAGAPVPPAGVDDLFRHLWQGPVAVRDLTLLEVASPEGPAGDTTPDDTTPDDTTPDDASNDDGEPSDDDATLGDAPGDDVVVVDRRDSYLVFTQISPSLVSTPSTGLSFRLEVGFDDDQLAAGSSFGSNSEAARQLIGEVLFFQGNVVSVDTVVAEGGAPTVSRVEIADDQFLDDAEEFAPILFGESEVVLADERIEGVDVVVTVGTGYLDLRGGS
jgi:hypothetical protein